jgi:hypothetical protein
MSARFPAADNLDENDFTCTFLSKQSAGTIFALMVSVCLYWAFVIGLFTLSIAVAI